MKNLQTSIVVEETWVEKHTENLNSQPTAINAFLLVLIRVLTSNSLAFIAVERKPKIEQVNLTGGRLIREAKVCRCLMQTKFYFFLSLSHSKTKQNLLFFAGFTQETENTHSFVVHKSK